MLFGEAHVTIRCALRFPRAACALTVILSVCLASLDNARGADDHPVRRVKVLFLGDEGHHVPRERARQLLPVAAQAGIDITYTEDIGNLNPATLNQYDDLLIYANITVISQDHEKALLDYVEGGHGLVVLHCGSYCFLNSPKYIALVGAQFLKHQTGVFRTKIVDPDHPIMKGFTGFESWDETYVHTKHNTENRTVLEMRDTEPYTWVRTQGKGRVFYTAWGHDERTWGNPGFQDLVERGIRWAAGDWAMGPQPQLPAFDFVQKKQPRYLQGAKWGVNHSSLLPMQLPVSPDESMQHMVVPQGFAVHLFASDPAIHKPICMAWDERGRLWVSETVDYPNQMQEAGQGHDQIVIVESPTGNPADVKTTVFADHLSIPTSICFANGGAIVAQAPDILFFKRNANDDTAGEKQVLIHGFGTRDTHAECSNLRFGFDGWIYGTVGYSGFEGTVGGKSLRFGEGFFRFKPDGSALEFLGSTNNNTWGLGISEDNHVFASTANGDPSFELAIPNRYYERVEQLNAHGTKPIGDTPDFYPITDKVRQVDHFGAYTAGAGSDLYTARSFPQQYWNRMQFVAEPTGHLLGKFILKRDGSGFDAINDFNLFASDDEWTSPIAGEVGPDGAVWMIDWYNYTIQHNPIPSGFVGGKGGAYETELRDKTHGRVYRITWDGAPEYKPMDLHEASPAELVATLKNDNMFWRMTALRMLIDKGDKSIVPDLIKLIQDQNVDAIGLNSPAIAALWALADVGALDGTNADATAAAVAALKHPSAAVRANAAMVLPVTSASADAILDAKLLSDDDAMVRKTALLALSERPASDNAGSALVEMLSNKQNGDDRWIPDAAIMAACQNDESFQKALFATFQVPTTGPAAAAPKENLIPNGSFEETEGDLPMDWKVRDYQGAPAKHDVVGDAHDGHHALRIESDGGSDASCYVDVPVKPVTDYTLSAWIKAEGVIKGSSDGALLNVHGTPFKTNAVDGTTDWTKVSVKFNSGNLRKVSINCLLGGWGLSKGTALYDDVELVESADAVIPGLVGKVASVVIDHYAHRAPVDSVVATLGSARKADPQLAALVIGSLAEGWPPGVAPQLGDEDVASLQALMKALPQGTRDRLLALADRWGRRDIFSADIAQVLENLRKNIADESLASSDRIDSATKLVSLDDSDAAPALVLKQISAQTPPDLQEGFVTSVGDSTNPAVGALLTKNWTHFSTMAQRLAVGLLLRKPQWTPALLDALESRKIQFGDLNPQDIQLLTQNPDATLAARAQQVEKDAGLASNADRQKVIDQFSAATEKTGDIAAGKAIFEKNCMVCHTFEGRGAQVGPELTGIGTRPKSELIIKILDPNRSVEGTYKAWTAETKSGDTFVGRLASESQTSVELVDTQGHHVLQRSDLKLLRSSNKTLMPEGFESLGLDGLANVMEFLQTSKVKR
jgi:putative membrane-bound dehydrogenase-like protein